MYIRKRTDQSWVQLLDLRFGVFQKTPVEIYFAITVPNISGEITGSGYLLLDIGPGIREQSPGQDVGPDSYRDWMLIIIQTQSGSHHNRSVRK